MEPDRYTNHQKLFIAGISCLVLAISFFFFSFYIVPFLIWRLNYQVPSFILMLQAYFQDGSTSAFKANFIVWLLFFIPSLITGFMAYYFSNKIENQIYKYETSQGEEKEEEKPQASPVSAEMKESASLAFKIIFLMITIVAVIFILQFVVAG